MKLHLNHQLNCCCYNPNLSQQTCPSHQQTTGTRLIHQRVEVVRRKEHLDSNWGCAGFMLLRPGGVESKSGASTRCEPGASSCQILSTHMSVDQSAFSSQMFGTAGLNLIILPINASTAPLREAHHLGGHFPLRVGPCASDRSLAEFRRAARSG